MDKVEIIWIASIVIAKSMSKEDLYYSDYMYGNEFLTDKVWEYVEEAEEQGMLWFKEAYKDYKLY